MARAKRHYIPGQIWHITHRCHKRDFLLKLVRDKQRWRHWLYQARKRYDLVILNYTVTSNHSHLLVFDDKGRDVIPQSIKLIAGRIGQEYNQRKKRKGAFWEDRYHATAVESKEHLLRCLAYIDLNMVRTGKVCHPSEWEFCGYGEIQNPRRKTVLINYQILSELAGFSSYDAFKVAHNDTISSLLANGNNNRQSKWTESIAVGSIDFVESIKEKLGNRCKGRNIIEHSSGYQLREDEVVYNGENDSRMENIDIENTYPWNNYNE